MQGQGDILLAMTNRLFLFARTLLRHRQTSILSAASIIMAMVFTSRILGLIRNRLLTSHFTPSEIGIYYASFRLPNLVFEILVIGTVSTAFIPVFSDYLARGRESDAFRLAASVINLSTLFFAVALIPLHLFIKNISQFLAPGFNTYELEQMVLFSRIILTAQVLPLLIGNFLTGILQSYSHFLLSASAPVVYNLGIILGIIFLSQPLGLVGVVVGVVIGAFFYLAIHLPQVIQLGYRHTGDFDYKSQAVRRVFRLALPRTIGLGIAQIDATVDLILASLLGAASVTIFTFAQQLHLVPVGLFGLTIAQATLPTLAQKSKPKQLREFQDIFLASWHQILFLAFPAAVLLFVLSEQSVRLVFGADRFDWPATRLTSKTLSFFSLSLLAQASIQLLIRAFFALQDTKTPVIIAAIAVTLNTFLSIYFIRVMHYPVWALALAASLGAFTNVILLFYLLHRKVGGFSLYQIIVPPCKMLLAAIFSGLVSFIQVKLLNQLVFDTTRTFNLILLTGIVGLSGVLVYAFMAWFLNIKEVLTFYNQIKRMIRVKDVILDTGSEVVAGEETL